VEEVCCEVPTRLSPPVHNTTQHDVLMTDCKQELTDMSSLEYEIYENVDDVLMTDCKQEIKHADVPSFKYELVDSNQGITSGFTDCIENESKENKSRMSVSMENSSMNENVVDSKVW